MIKRTFYRESIITGAGVEVPELEKMLDTRTATVAHVPVVGGSKLTTRVTLNMSKFARRSSDYALQPMTTYAADTPNGAMAPHMTDARHSICGSEMVPGNRLAGRAIGTVSGRSLEQFLNRTASSRMGSCTCVPSSGSQLSMSSRRTSRSKVRQWAWAILSN